MRPSWAVNVSQMLGPRPSSATAPSTWYAAVLVPNLKPGGSWGNTGTMFLVSVEIRRGTSRFVTREEGRETRHSFSFGEHYDPDNTRFGALVCHDDHRLRAGAGFAEHEHRDLEIVTWVLSGSVEHSDGTGGTGGASVVTPGTVQLLSAGSGVRHAEVAGAGTGPTRFVQAW